MSDAIRIFEVGPRDGLQNERVILSTADKVWLIRELSAQGLTRLEAGALVRADRVPQMADSEEVQREILAARLSGEFFYLVPNQKGLERAVRAGIKHIAVFTAASNSFNQKNIGMTCDESLGEIRAIATEASRLGIKVRGYVSTAWGCPFEGRIEPIAVHRRVDELLSLPIEEVSIGDTIGVASAKGVREVLHPLISRYGSSRLAVHFHDTRGSALANAFASYELGVRTFDASVGGLGGCPFAPGASGNLSTEDLVYFFKESGIPTGVNYSGLCSTSLELHRRMGKNVFSSRALQAYQANCAKNPVWDC
ncbi:MAG: hydroxymethylglutaryl-CoA lyase [Proteobacteria bacterium]|nr:hydroxymethylglutaryl-CoA lyase [Pseudomonadota bacterium]